MQGNRAAGEQGCRETGLPGNRAAGEQGYRGTGLPGNRAALEPKSGLNKNRATWNLAVGELHDMATWHCMGCMWEIYGKRLHALLNMIYIRKKPW